MGFDKNLQALRSERGVTQEQLAEKLSLSRQAITKWETGGALPGVEHLVLLCDYFRVSMDWLVRDDSSDCGRQRDAIREAYDHDGLIEFLLRAKRATYAGKGSETTSSRTNSHDFCYAEGDLRYLDTYLGSERFSGEEAVWRGERPIWAMNYTGRVLANGFSGDFLKEALLRGTPDYPYRGPLLYRSGEHTYHAWIHGGFEWFNGHEGTYFRDVKVYECAFHGGAVK